MNIIRKHPYIAAIVTLVLLGGGYWWYQTTHPATVATQYTLGTVSSGTVISTVTASGQVAASDETDIKARVSGDIVSVSVKAGSSVQQGTVIARIESNAAERAVSDAELAVEEARLNLEHDTLKAPIDHRALQNDLDQAVRNLATSYQDAHATLSGAYIKSPDVLAGIEDILNNSDINPNSKNLFVSSPRDQETIQSLLARANDDYRAAHDSYTASVTAFRALTRASDNETIAAALKASGGTEILIAQAAASESNFIDSLIEMLERHNLTVDSDITSAQTSVRTYITNANDMLASRASAQKAIDDATDAVANAQHVLDLAEVGNLDGSNPFDLKLLQNTLKQKEAALSDARQNLADHAIRAPFSGIIASLDIRPGGSVASGGSVGTLVTDQQIAELSLNEVDAAKVKTGDKTTLTFDAIEGLTLTGEVAEIDPIGTVSQGVVSYTIKIATDTQDPRVKPGMTVNADIQTAVHQNVLIVPSSAIKTTAGASFVQVFDPALPDTDGSVVTPTQTPRNIPVTIGISDDTNTEVTSGLTAGRQIITKTTAGGTTKSTAASATSRTNGGFGGSGGGGNVLRGL